MDRIELKKAVEYFKPLIDAAQILIDAGEGFPEKKGEIGHAVTQYQLGWNDCHYAMLCIIARDYVRKQSQ